MIDVSVNWNTVYKVLFTNTAVSVDVHVHSGSRGKRCISLDLSDMQIN